MRSSQRPHALSENEANPTCIPAMSALKWHHVCAQWRRLSRAMQPVLVGLQLSVPVVVCSMRRSLSHTFCSIHITDAHFESVQVRFKESPLPDHLTWPPKVALMYTFDPLLVC